DLPAWPDILGISAPPRAKNAVARQTIHRTRELRRDRKGSAVLGRARAHRLLYGRLDLARAVDWAVSGAGNESRLSGKGIRARGSAGPVGNSDGRRRAALALHLRVAGRDCQRAPGRRWNSQAADGL